MEYFKKEFNYINLKYNELHNKNVTLTNNVNDLEESLLTVSDETDIFATQNKKLQSTIDSLEIKIKSLTDENENYSKVSVVKNLHNQIYEKDNLIAQLQYKINKIKNEPLEIKIEEEAEVDVEEESEVDVEEEAEVEEDAEVEEEAEVDVEEEAEVEEEVEEEVEVEFVEKKLKSPNSKSRKLTLFLITDDEHKDIYEHLDNGEPGEHVGKLVGKQNKPFFFSK